MSNFYNQRTQMKRIILYWIVYLFLGAVSFAQTTFKGVLLNESKEPIPSANIILLSLPDSTLVKGAISDDRGFFEISNLTNSKNIALKITHLEYKDKVILPQSFDLGIVVLEAFTNELGEVVISVSKPIMKQQGTAIITNIAQSTLKDLPQLSMVIDFLPGVSQSAFGGMEVFGKQNPIFYINNRLVRDKVDLMKISPQEVESIEIETQPGAEHDNSVGAIIRIRLKKKQGEGLGGLVGVQSDFKKGIRAHIAMNLNYRVRKTDFFILAQPETKSALFYEDNQELSVKTSTQNWQVITKNTQKDNGKSFYGKAGFIHEFNDKHSVGASISTRVTPFSGHTFTDQETQTFQNGVLAGNGFNAYDRFNKNRNTLSNAYYEGKLSEKLKLQTDIDYFGTRSDYSSDILEKNLLSSTERNVKTNSEAKSDWIALKTTLSQKLGKGGLGYGFEGSTFSREEKYNDNVLTFASNIENKEIRSALFVSYSFPWGKTNFKTGLRYEYTDFEYFENNQKREVQSRSYRNLLPNLSFSFPWDKTQWSVSYIKKIRRPAFFELSDYSSYSSPFLYNRGNSNIVPTLTDEISFLTTYKNYSLAVEYSFIENSIYNDYRLHISDPNVIEKTIRNFEDYQTLKLVFSGHHKIGIFRPKTTLTFFKQFGEGVFERNVPVFNAGIESQILFSKKWMGTWSMNYYSKGSFANTYYYKDRFYTDFFVIGTFPKHSLQLYTGVLDIFNSNKIYGEFQNPFITNKSFITNNNSRTFIIALIYRFNPTQNKYKGQGESDEKSRMYNE